MVNGAYAIYDLKAKAYALPFFAINAAVALRQFGSLCNQPESSVSKYPEDYILFEIGEFDDVKGLLSGLDKPVSLGKALQYKEDADDRIR